MAVRRESVELSLVDHFSTDMVKAAAATALLHKELDRLSHEAVQTSKTTRQIDKDVDNLGKTSKRTDKDIDRLSGRLRILADVAAILAPTIAPIGAVSVAAIGGLANQLGFAAVGAGTAVLAFQGVGDALKALNKADLEPTEANLAAARLEMERLSPAARHFTRQLAGMKPELKELRDIAATGLLPGLSEGLDELEGAFPRVEAIVAAISTELGSIAADTGESLGSERWAPFLDFIAREGPSSLQDFATAAGNTAHALAGLWMATDPLNDDFSKWLVNATADLDRWAEGVGQTEGFAEFLAYVEETGPQVEETLGALASAALQIVEATAPLGGPVLQGLEAFAKVIGAIADSDVGTPIFAGVAALALYNRTMAITASLQKSTFGGPAIGSIKAQGGAIRGLAADVALFNRRTSGGVGKDFIGPLTKADTAARRLRSTLGGMSKGGGALALFAASATGAADSIGLANTATLGMVGSLAGKTGIGVATGAVLDLFDAMYKSGPELDAYTQKVAGLAGPGVADQLAAVNAELAKQKAIFDDPNGPSFDVFGTKIAPLSGFGGEWEQAGENVEALEKQSKALQLQLDSTTVATEYAASAAGKHAARSARQENALRLVGQASRQVGQQFVAFGEDLDNSKVSLDKWIENMHKRNDALQNFASNSLKAQDNGVRIGLIEELRKTPEGALRLAELAKALPAQVKAANREWRRNRNAIKDNTAAGEELRKKAQQIANGKYDLKFTGIEKAKNDAQNLYSLMNRIAGFNISSLLNPGPKSVEQMFPGFGVADGGTVPGARHPYGDSVFALLAPTEEVITNRNGEADRFRADRAAGRIPAYADGGTVGRSGGTPRIDLYDYIRKDLDMKVPHTVKQWDRALAASTRQLEKDTNKRQDLLDQAEQVRSSIMSGYKSDLFGDQGSSVWQSDADRAAAGKGDVFSILTGDNARLDALTAAEKQLKAKGLDSAAYADLVSNASLEQVQAFAAGPKADVIRYENLYNQREKKLVAAGNVGADAAFGPVIKAANAQAAESKKMTAALTRVERLLEKNPNATGAAIARAINGAVPKRGRR